MKNNKQKPEKKGGLKKESKFCWVLIAILSLLCVLPILMVLSASLTDETYIQQYGYRLFPANPSVNTYIFLIGNKGKMLLRAFGMTLTVVILGTVYSLTVTTCFAYAITQNKEVFYFNRSLSFIAWFTSIFSGGVMPWYILCTQYYGLKNNVLALFIPYGMSVWNMFILRGNFREIPVELIESARLDGASHSRIFLNIAIPLARAGILAVALFNIFGYWNDFFLPLWLTTDSKYQTLQKMLYTMLANARELLRNSELAAAYQSITLPTETAKMAVAVMAILPVVLIYPFTLKYFIKGINVGGIKG